jgi:hypothetical protein
MMRLNRFSVRRNADAVQRNTYVAVLPMSNPASLDADSGELTKTWPAPSPQSTTTTSLSSPGTPVMSTYTTKPQSPRNTSGRTITPNPRYRGEEFELRGGVSARTP